MTTIQGRTITDEHVQIDDTRFIGCTLVRCTLAYEGGEIVFDSTVLRNCSYVFYGSARRTVQLIQEIGLMPFIEQEWHEFLPPKPGTLSDGH